MKKRKSLKLQHQARKLIPGGTQLLSKRPERFAPGIWPGYYEKAKGAYVWDMDGTRYLDMSISGIGANILGFADPDVDRAVTEAIRKGNSSSFNCPEEIELAKKLCDIHRWADMARFARTGGESAVIAVRIARASAGKDIVLFSGYHGWHDWYLAANLASDSALDGHLLPGLMPKGVPRGLKGTAIPFKYNDIEELKRLVKRYKGKIACCIMEPIRNHYPKKGFLEAIRRLTEREGIVLIFDEISSGWRLNVGGAHLKFGVSPDLCVFAKAISNGYPMGAVIGRKDIMEAAQDTFISSTYWTERIGPVAALATIKKLKRQNVPAALCRTGKNIQKVWMEKAKMHGLPIEISGIYPMSHFEFKHASSQVLGTLFTQFMLKYKILASNSFYASYAHSDRHISLYEKACERAFGRIAQAVDKGKPEEYLESSVRIPGFARLT